MDGKMMGMGTRLHLLARGMHNLIVNAAVHAP